jgi:hypothetical protein
MKKKPAKRKPSPKKLSPNNRRTKVKPGPERRKGPRTVHVIDEHTSYRDEILARADLENFFLDVLDKHHGLANAPYDDYQDDDGDEWPF